MLVLINKLPVKPAFEFAEAVAADEDPFGRGISLDFDFQFAARKGDHVGHGIGVEDAAAVGTEETDGIEQLLELVEGIIDGIGMAV